MIEKISAWLSVLPRELYIFIISMLPIVELRGAIPVGAALNVPFYWNYLIAVVGNLLPVPLILLFIPKFLNFLERFKPFRPMVTWLRKKAEKNSGKIIKKTESNADEIGTEEIPAGEGSAEASRVMQNPAKKPRMGKGVFAALIIFVALPLPGTGAWTGSLVAALFNLPKKQSFLAATLGVMISGVIMCLASYGVVGFLKFLV